MLDSVERQRLQELSVFESQAYADGYRCIAGVDEAGRGALAGPVVAAACLLPRGVLIAGINDSKQLSPDKRESLFRTILSLPDVSVGIGVIEPLMIDEINILQATFRAMELAIENLKIPPDYLLIDGNRSPTFSMPVRTLVKGDSRSHSIAAASIVAKVTRDRLMEKWHGICPVYGFNRHKGYGTPHHYAALEEYGLCSIHRRTFLKNRLLSKLNIQAR